MKDLVTLTLMCAVALLPYGGYSFIIDRTNCSRSNPIFYDLTKDGSLSEDLRSLGIDLDVKKQLLRYSVSDSTTDIELFTNTQQYFYVIGSSVTSGTYLCANRITSTEFSQLIVECEQPSVLSVNLGNCQVSSQVDSTVKAVKEVAAKLKEIKTLDYKDGTEVTKTILKSNGNTFSVFYVKSNPPQYLGCKHQRNNGCRKPRLISKSEHNAYVEKMYEINWD